MLNRFTVMSLCTGYVLIVGGFGLYSRPLGLIVAGLGLLAVGILSARRKK